LVRLGTADIAIRLPFDGHRLVRVGSASDTAISGLIPCGWP
jgi:hypothetical protein